MFLFLPLFQPHHKFCTGLVASSCAVLNLRLVPVVGLEHLMTASRRNVWITGSTRWFRAKGQLVEDCWTCPSWQLCQSPLAWSAPSPHLAWERFRISKLLPFQESTLLWIIIMLKAAETSWISNHWISAGNQETRPLPWCWFGCLGHKVKFCIRRCLVYLHGNGLLVADMGDGLWWADGWLKLAKMRRLWVGAFAKSSLDVLPSWPTWMDSNVMVKKPWNRMMYDPVFRLGNVLPIKMHTSYVSFMYFFLDVAFWVVEWVWSIHIHKPYRILPLPPCQSHAMSTMYSLIGGYRSFCRSCQVNCLKQVKKDSNLFDTVCSSRQNRIHRNVLSHRENFMTGLCLFSRWSRMYASS